MPPQKEQKKNNLIKCLFGSAFNLGPTEYLDNKLIVCCESYEMRR